MKPVLKWLGGKSRLLPEILKRVPDKFNRYYEPFVGGAAVLLAIQPDQAVVADINEELINVYNTIVSFPEDLITDLQRHKNEASYFYQLRGLDRVPEYQTLTPVERASRIIYLNKTCYNGLFRVNSRGELNASFGKYANPLICDAYNLRGVSRYFNAADIQFLNVDFSDAVSTACCGDFVYFDPPYDPISKTSDFIRYTKDKFSHDDHKRLLECCDMLHDKGVKFLLSNSATDFIRNLYERYHVDVIRAPRTVSCKGGNRKAINEVLIYNY